MARGGRNLFISLPAHTAAPRAAASSVNICTRLDAWLAVSYHLQ